MATSGPVGVGFIGTGMISSTYLENLTRFPDVEVTCRTAGQGNGVAFGNYVARRVLRSDDYEGLR